jgi:autotransporter-associated beta strand protein
VCNANNQIATTAQVTVNPTGELNLNDYNNTVSFLHVAGGHVTSGNGTLTVTSNIVCDTADDGSALSGKLNLGPNGSNVILNDDANLTIYAVVGGAASAPLQVSGSGELRLTANNTYAGPTTINGGRLLVNGTQTNSAVTLSGGTLGGIGTIGPLTANSGHLAPGTSAGRLRVGGNTALGTAATFLVELNGLAAGISYDQLVVNGSVNLAGAVLDGSIGFVSTPGNAFTILVNEGTDSIQGTFAGLAQGTVFALGGEYFSIRYDGGTGNDIVLTRVNRPALLSGPVRLNSGQFQFEGFGEASLSYLIQANTNPGTTNWFTLGSAVANGAGLFQFLDTNALLFPQRFYRAVAP